jgi:hypothetical protein
MPSCNAHSLAHMCLLLRLADSTSNVLHVHTLLCLHTSMHTCTEIFFLMNAYIYISIQTNKQTHTRTHKHTHTHTQKITCSSKSAASRGTPNIIVVGVVMDTLVVPTPCAFSAHTLICTITWWSSLGLHVWMHAEHVAVSMFALIFFRTWTITVDFVLALDAQRPQLGIESTPTSGLALHRHTCTITGRVKAVRTNKHFAACFRVASAQMISMIYLASPQGHEISQACALNQQEAPSDS